MKQLILLFSLVFAVHCGYAQAVMSADPNINPGNSSLIASPDIKQSIIESTTDQNNNYREIEEVTYLDESYSLINPPATSKLKMQNSNVQRQVQESPVIILIAASSTILPEEKVIHRPSQVENQARPKN